MGAVTFKKVIVNSLRFAAAVLSLYVLSAFIDVQSSLVYALSVPIASSVIFLNIASVITERKKASLHKYNDKGVVSGFMSRRTISYIFAVLAALFLSFFILVKLYISSDIEKIALLLALPVFMIARLIAVKFASNIYSEFYKTSEIKRITYLLSAVILGILYPLTVYFAGGYGSGGSSFSDISVQSFAALTPLEGNPIAYVVGYLISFSDSLSVFLLMTASSSGSIYLTGVLAVLFAGNSLFFYGLINYIGAFSLNKNEIKGVFEPLMKKENEPDTNKFMAAFIFVLVLFFIYPAFFAFVRAEIVAKSAVFDYVKEKAKVAVEIIDGAVYRLGTIREIEIAKASIYGESRIELEKAVNKTYDEMEANVDKYLDWYYSLGGEYSRIYKLLTGSVEEYMQEKLRKAIAPSEGLNQAFAVFNENTEKAKAEIEKILQQNRLDLKDGQYKVAINTNIEDVYKKNEIKNIINLKERLILSVGASFAAGAIASKVAGRIASKTAFKTASKAAAKMAAQKGAGAALSTVTGAFTSVFTSPVGGAAIGIATGVALDKGMLKLEEAINRDQYKSEIISSLEESRRQTLKIIDDTFKDNNPSEEIP